MKKIILGIFILIAALSAIVYSKRNDIRLWWSYTFVTPDLIDKALQDPPGKIVSPQTTAEMAALFQGAQSTAVPRIYVDRLPDDFNPQTTADKTLFIEVITALVLRTNEQILNERHALQV